MAKNPDGTPRMFNLATDLALLLSKIDEIGDVVLVIIDPVSAYLGVGKVNNSSTTDVRAVLAPLTKLAEEKKISIIGIMHFNKKADVTNAMLRIADSLAYVAAEAAKGQGVDGGRDEGWQTRNIDKKAEREMFGSVADLTPRHPSKA